MTYLKIMTRDDIDSRTILNWAYNDTTGGLTVDVQDQTTPLLSFYFGKIEGYTTLASDTSINSKTLTLTSAIGFVDGIGILIRTASPISSTAFYIGQQIGAAVGNIITIDIPLDYAFSTGDIVYYGTNNMAVDGSVTPQVFEVFGPRIGSFDVTNILIKMLTDTTVSLDLFGDIPALTEGCVLRVIQSGIYHNISSFKQNSDFAFLSKYYKVFTSTNPVQGQDGIAIILTFAGQQNYGVAIRLTGENDKLQFIIQDDLSDLVEFRILAEGHVIQ